MKVALRTPRIAVALGLAGALLAACDLDGSTDGGKYVAIGDSYTAAPGAGRPVANDTCFRSANNYPHLVAEEGDFDLTDVSCSAATSFAVTESQVTPQGRTIPPQIEAVTSDTDVVSIGIGANDYNLIGRVLLTCVQLARTNPTGAPCSNADAVAGARSVESRLAEVERNIGAVIDAVRERAPKAEIVVIGYPQIFPDDSTCALLPIAAGDLALARKVNLGLNDALEAASDDRDVEFVDTYEATEGHNMCSADPWIAGAQVLGGRQATPWHPFPEEQEAVADLVLDAIT